MTAERMFALVVVLAVAVFVSALSGVYARHQARTLFVELDQLVRDRDRLEVEWGQLQIEHSTLASHARVEQAAREQLSMRSPRPEEIRKVAH